MYLEGRVFSLGGEGKNYAGGVSKFSKMMKFHWAISVPNIWGANFGHYKQNSPRKLQLRAKILRAHSVCSSGPWGRGPAGSKRGVPYPEIHERSTPLSAAHVLRGGIFRRPTPSASFAWFYILIVLLHFFPKVGMASYKPTSGKLSYNRCNSKSHTRLRNLILTTWDLFKDFLEIFCPGK